MTWQVYHILENIGTVFALFVGLKTVPSVFAFQETPP